MLAAGCAGGRVGELGTGAGIGAGWMASASDIKRQFFSGEPRLVSTEVVLPGLGNSLLVGTRTK